VVSAANIHQFGGVPASVAQPAGPREGMIFTHEPNPIVGLELEPVSGAWV
jgi:hypothetical protein